MNTNNVYYGMLRGSVEAEHKFNNYCTDVWTVSSVSIKPVLVLVTQPYEGEINIKDLNTKEKYMTEIPLKVGKLFVHPAYLLPFNYFDNVPNKLSKRKVLKIGNENLKEAEKTLKLKSDFSKDTIYKRYICKNNKFYVVTK